MKYLKYFENMNKQTYIIEWELEDISGDCSHQEVQLLIQVV